MDVLVDWVLGLVAGLFAVAALVAWWEHLGRRREQPEPQQPGEAPARPMGVDVELDALAAEASGNAGDAAARRAALGGALDRMSAPGTAARRTWVDTAPMIGLGLREPQEPAKTPRDETSSSSL